MRKIIEGSLVTIISIHNTRDIHGLDSDGDMESMVGKVFKAERVRTESIRIKSEKYDGVDYIWSIKDMRPVEEKETEPIIFKFDDSQLII